MQAENQDKAEGGQPTYPHSSLRPFGNNCGRPLDLYGLGHRPLEATGDGKKQHNRRNVGFVCIHSRIKQAFFLVWSLPSPIDNGTTAFKTPLE
jgi:hypothetical protein